MSHANIIYDSDPHFTINTTTRQIVNDSSKKTTLMQYDHNSERFSFSLDRFIEGHDMLECNCVEVHYKNDGVYEVKDLQIDPEDESKLVFSWLVSGDATQTVGALDFLIRFACVLDDDTVDYAWHTAVFKGISVTSGMNNGKAVAESYPDVLAQWKSDLFGASAEGVTNINIAKETAMEEIEAKGESTKNSLPDDYVALSEAVNDRANALKGSASGASVHIDDVSPVAHKPIVKVSGVENLNEVTLLQNGKNLSKNVTRTGKSGNLTLLLENNLLTINGAGTSNVGVAETSSEAYCFLLQPGTYTFSAQYVGGVCNSTGSDGMYCGLRIMTTNKNLVNVGIKQTYYTGNYSKAFTITEPTWCYARFVGYGDFENLQYLYQVEAGSKMTPYEEYKEASYPVNADGTVDDVALFHPYTSLIPDAEGAIVECQYNKDSNIVIEKLTNAIISLGGNV